MTTRALILSLSLMAALAGAMQMRAQAQSPDPARVAAAKELMTYSGAVRQFEEAMPLIFNQLSQSFTAVAPDKANEIREVFGMLLPRFMERKSELIDQIAVLYAQELTLNELNAIVAFYKTPAGLKFAGAQAVVVRQSVALGQRWGERIGRDLEAEARRELKKRGVDL